jgi:ATP-dependent protease ClpP protease subunit
MRPIALAYSRAGLDPSPVALQAAGSHTIDMYDVIGDFWGEGVHARGVSALLPAEGGDITVRINSPGGDAFEGAAVRSVLRAYAVEHKAKIRVEIHGLAASAASIVALAGDEIAIAPGAFVMIHEAWSFVIGEADQMRKEAGILDKINASMAKLYAERMGVSDDEARALMAEETWFTADEAVEAGFAHAVLEESVDTGEPNERASALLTRWSGVPDALRAVWETADGRALAMALDADPGEPESDEEDPDPDDDDLEDEDVDEEDPEDDEGEDEFGDVLEDSRDDWSTPEAALARFRGDATATIAALLDDVASLRAEEARLRAELDALESAQARAPIDGRIEALTTRGVITPGEASYLRGLDDPAPALALFENRAPLAQVEQSHARRKAALTVTPEMRRQYPAFVSDETILATEARFRGNP